MKAKDALKKAALVADMPITRIGVELGYTRQYAHAAMDRKDIGTQRLARMLAVCGYRLCAVPVEQVSESMLVID